MLLKIKKLILYVIIIPLVFSMFSMNNIEGSERKEIIEVNNPINRTVAYDTKAQNIGLPETVRVKLQNNEEVNLKVNWNTTNYNSKVSGIYKLQGTLELASGISNTTNITVSTYITVAKQIQGKNLAQDKIIKDKENLSVAYVDLGSKKIISECFIYFDFNEIEDKKALEFKDQRIKIEISNDNEVWSTVYNKFMGSESEILGYRPYVCDFKPCINGRYVRFTLSPELNKVATYQIYEHNDVINVREPDEVIVTEGIDEYNLPLPHQLSYDSDKCKYLSSRLNIFPYSKGKEGWYDIDHKIDVNTPNTYTYLYEGVDDDHGFASNPNHIYPKICVTIRKAGILSFLVKNQVGNTDIDYENQTIDVKVLPDTDVSKIYPIITLTDYTTCDIKNGESVDFSEGEVEFNIKAVNGHTYKWIVKVTKDNNVQNSIYVSTEGNDNNDGSINHPFRTLNRAKEYIRTINKNMTGNIIVYLRGGEYYLTKTIKMDESDSGTNGYKVIYKSYEDEKPIIFGGKKVTGWEKAQDKSGAYIASSPDDIDYSRELYVNGRRAIIARDRGVDIKGWSGYDNPNINWQDEGEYPKIINNKTVHESYCTNKEYEYNDMINWRNINDIEFCYMVGWTFHIVPMDKIIKSTEGLRIYLKRPGFDIVQSNIGPLTVTDPNYIQNAFELLDEPGESYFDRTSKKIYYIPREGEDINKIEAYVPLVEDILVGTGQEDNFIKDIQFNGISFECTGYDRPHSPEGAVTGQASFLQSSKDNDKMPGTIKFDYAKNVIFDNCTFKMIGKAGLDFNNRAQNNIVMGCTFDGIASSGIQIGDKGTAETRYADLDKAVKNNKIVSNKITNIGESFNGAVGIWIGFGKNSLVAFNDISNVSYTGISCGWSWGYGCPTIATNNIIEYNHITNVLQKLQDGGSIYVLGYQPGSRIRGNHIHDNKVGIPGGIYLDEGSSGYTDISENVIYRISDVQPDCFYFNYNVGYWGNQVDRDMMVKHMNNVMKNNFPHNLLTYQGSENRINPKEPDLNLPFVVKTINNAGIHQAYK